MKLRVRDIKENEVVWSIRTISGVKWLNLDYPQLRFSSSGKVERVSKKTLLEELNNYKNQIVKTIESLIKHETK